MEIKEFSDLTNFIGDEYNKMSEMFDIKKPSDEFCDFVSKSLVKYSRVYDKPLYKLQKMSADLLYCKNKLEIDIERAIFTMPHGFIWKLFHWRLWKKVQLRLGEQNLPDEAPKEMTQEIKNVVVTVPAVLNDSPCLPELVDDN